MSWLSVRARVTLARRVARARGGDVVAVGRSPGGRFELRLPVIT
jgi:hypothetical protein